MTMFLVPLPLCVGLWAAVSLQTPVQALVIGAVGDFLFQSDAQKKAFEDTSRGYGRMWAPLGDLLTKPDLLYGNFEGVSANVKRIGNGTCVPMEDPERVYGEVFGSKRYYPGDILQVNYHPVLPRNLAAAGFDVVSTVNNHACDRCTEGLIGTLRSMETAGLQSFGTRGDANAQFHTVTNVSADGRRWRIAWVGCTTWVNSVSINGCNKQYWLKCTDAEFVASIQRLAADTTVDGIVAAIHGGVKCSTGPTPDVREHVFAAITAGAFLVLASHPHVPQPIERFRAHGRDNVVVWSLGNFVGEGPRDRTTSGNIFFQVVLGPHGAEVSCLQYVPLCMDRDSWSLSTAVREGCELERDILMRVWGREYEWDGIGDFMCAQVALPTSRSSLVRDPSAETAVTFESCKAEIVPPTDVIGHSADSGQLQLLGASAGYGASALMVVGAASLFAAGALVGRRAKTMAPEQGAEQLVQE